MSSYSWHPPSLRGRYVFAVVPVAVAIGGWLALRSEPELFLRILPGAGVIVAVATVQTYGGNQPPKMAHGFLSLALRACMGNPLHPSPQRKQGNTGRPHIPCRTGLGLGCRSLCVPVLCRDLRGRVAECGGRCRRRLGRAFRDGVNRPNLPVCTNVVVWHGVCIVSMPQLLFGSGERHHGCHCLPAS